MAARKRALKGEESQQRRVNSRRRFPTPGDRAAPKRRSFDALAALLHCGLPDSPWQALWCRPGFRPDDDGALLDWAHKVTLRVRSGASSHAAGATRAERGYVDSREGGVVSVVAGKIDVGEKRPPCACARGHREGVTEAEGDSRTGPSAQLL